jgi:hypothetical protein
MFATSKNREKNSCIKTPRNICNISHVLPQYILFDFVTNFREVCNIEKSWKKLRCTIMHDGLISLIWHDYIRIRLIEGLLALDPCHVPTTSLSFRIGWSCGYRTRRASSSSRIRFWRSPHAKTAHSKLPNIVAKSLYFEAQFYVPLQQTKTNMYHWNKTWQ